MKRIIFWVVLVAGGYFVIGVLQIVCKNQWESRQASQQRLKVKADLRFVYGAIKEAENNRENRRDLAGLLGLTALNYPVADYTLFPAAKGFEPLVVYNGQAKWAVGYRVLANGIVNNGRGHVTQVEESRTLNSETDDSSQGKEILEKRQLAPK